MKCIELIDEIKSWSVCEINPEKTCDTIKCGDAQTELKKAAVTMFATPDVVRAAVEWGAQLLIVHEPVFYDHMDKRIDTFIAQKKKEFVENSGLVIFRCHDYAHTMSPDIICEGELNDMGVKGKCVEGEILGTNKFILDDEITALELVKIIEEKLGLKHVRIAGNPNAKIKQFSCCFGTPGHLEEQLEESDAVLTGEICEWRVGEMARDYAQLGYNKALIVMTHVGSERAGMMLLEKRLEAAYPEIEFKYIECGEVFQYTD